MRFPPRQQPHVASVITQPHIMPRLVYFLTFLSTCIFLYIAWELAGGDPLLPQTQSGRAITKRPNIVLILTDDQDLHMNSLDYMPLTRQLIADQGTEFTSHFCTNALCCPSRVTLWTGKSPHNHNVTDVNPPHGISDLVLSPLVYSYLTSSIRRVSQIRLPRLQRQLPPLMATGGWLQNLLHRQALQRS